MVTHSMAQALQFGARTIMFHRGQIVLHLKYAKMALDPKAGFELWEWEKI